MASKQNEEVEKQVREDSRRSDAGDAPFSGSVKSPDAGRDQVVGEPVETSFDERTGVAQPFLKKDGTQDNGLEDLSEVEGASATQTRANDNTTVEETRKAVKEGKIPASDLPDKKEPAKNPVK